MSAMNFLTASNSTAIVGYRDPKVHLGKNGEKEHFCTLLKMTQK